MRKLFLAFFLLFMLMLVYACAKAAGDADERERILFAKYIEEHLETGENRQYGMEVME